MLSSYDVACRDSKKRIGLLGPLWPSLASLAKLNGISSMARYQHMRRARATSIDRKESAHGNGKGDESLFSDWAPPMEELLAAVPDARWAPPEPPPSRGWYASGILHGVSSFIFAWSFPARTYVSYKECTLVLSFTCMNEVHTLLWKESSSQSAWWFSTGARSKAAVDLIERTVAVCLISWEAMR